ncbi:MAG TPA: LysE family translocator [Thermoleophilaceae bacterium]|nr:LysE family translocator [Thermoleophilaceae bacterium]
MREPLLFLGVITLLTITPGADMAMVSRSVFLGGRRAAFATTLGIGAGCMVWAIASAAGVAAVLAASETAYDALRLVGAAYLVWLGLTTLWSAARGYGEARLDAGAPASGPTGLLGRPFRQGLLTNLFNPKIALFYTTFLPQFIKPGDPVLLLSIAMASVHVLLGIVWLSAYAWLLDRAVETFKSSRLRRALDAVTGAVLVAFGIRVAAD